jgi:hypothetical protein
VPRVADSSASLLFGTRRAVQGGQQRGARHAHLRTRKGCGPLARRKVLSLALSLTAALAWPVLALAQASDQAPPKPENVLPPDQPFRTPYREERALHERRCQTPRFPGERDAFVGGQILSPES